MKENLVRGLIYSRSLRKKATNEEKILKKALDKAGIHYRFQRFFYNDNFLFIPDFVLSLRQRKLVVEIDGISHKYNKDYDDFRTLWLERKRNCFVIRFTNEEIMENIDRVIAEILKNKPKMKYIINYDRLMSSRRNKDFKKYDIEKRFESFNSEFRSIVNV